MGIGNCDSVGPDQQCPSGFLRSIYWKVKNYIEIFTSDAVVFIGGIVKKRTISIYLQ